MKAKLLFTAMIMLFATSVAMSQNAKKYEIKSGIIKMKMNMGMQIDATQYFDDYGKLGAVDMVMSVMGNTKKMRTINMGKSNVVIDMDTKMAQKTPSEEINFMNLTDEVKEKYKIQEIGEETVLDKPCKKYSSEVSQGGQTVKTTTWIWKGITLKSEATVAGQTIKVEVTEFQENPEIDPEIFTIPEGVKIQ